MTKVKVAKKIDLWDYTNQDEVVCLYCDHKMDASYFHDLSKEDGDLYTAVIECDECHKSFNCSVQKYNQNDGYTSTFIDCEAVSKKHLFKFDKEIVSSYAPFDSYNMYECSRCQKHKLKVLDENKKEMSEKEISDKAFFSAKKNQPLTKDKNLTLHLLKETLSLTTSIAEGNREVFLFILENYKKMGFAISKPSDKDSYKASPYYMQGNWKGLEFEANYHDSSIRVDFFQNVSLSENSYGGKYDNRKKEKMSYLMQKRLEYSLNTMARLLEENSSFKVSKKLHQSKSHYGANIDSENLSFKEKIKILEEHSNTEVAYYNNSDSEKIAIKKADYRYGYDYQGNLARGKVYHNINNMWWLVTNTTILNKASFELFSFKEGMPTKKKKNHLQALKSELKKAIDAENFEKCILLRDEIKKASK